VIKNNQWWSEFRTAMRMENPNVFLVGEVWNKDSIVATYLKSGLDASFNFDLSGAIIKAIRDTNALGFVDKLEAIHRLYRTYNPDFTDATFVSNHDQDRYCSTFEGNGQKTRMAFAILMTLPGLPFLYYGEEIGMLGKFPDEYRREPFLWSRNTKENTNWETPKYSTPQTIIPLNEQVKDSLSLFHFYKRMIALRRNNPVLSEGRIAVTSRITPHKSVIAYELSSGKKKVLVVHNIGPQEVSINLPAYKKLLAGKKLRGQSILDAYSTFIVEL
jgi:alpha-amylase